MLPHALYRLGRFAARRPWTVIGAWLIVSVLVVGASGAFGQRARRLLRGPGPRLPGSRRPAHGRPLGPGRAHRPGGPDTARRPARRSSTRPTRGPPWPRSGRRPPACPRCSAPPTRRSRPTAGVALLRVQYPVLEELDKGDLENLKALGVRAASGIAAADRDGRRPVLRVRGGRDGHRRAGRPGRRGRHPAAGVRIGHRHGPADRHGHLRPRPRHQLDVADHLPGRHPQPGPRCSAPWSASAWASTTRCSSSPGTASTSPAG